MIVPLGYVTTFPAARNASTCEGESGVRIIWRRSSPIVSTQAPQVGFTPHITRPEWSVTDVVGTSRGAVELIVENIPLQSDTSEMVGRRDERFRVKTTPANREKASNRMQVLWTAPQRCSSGPD